MRLEDGAGCCVSVSDEEGSYGAVVYDDVWSDEAEELVVFVQDFGEGEWEGETAFGLGYVECVSYYSVIEGV